MANFWAEKGRGISPERFFIIFALTKRTRGLPVFSPLDDWEPLDIAKLPGYDFVFVDLEAHAEEEQAEQCSPSWRSTRNSRPS